MGVALFALLFFIVFKPLAYSMWRTERAAALEGDLIGAGDDLLPNGAIPFLQVGSIGTTFVMSPEGEGKPYIAPFTDSDFLIESGKEGPLVSTTVRDRNGQLIVKIMRNHWQVYPPYCLDKNYTKSAFEVLDSSDHVLLQFKFVSGPPRVQLQGEWWNNEGRGLRIVVSQGQGLVIPLAPQNQHNDALIKPMFKYPSQDHWGEFDSN